MSATDQKVDPLRSLDSSGHRRWAASRKLNFKACRISDHSLNRRYCQFANETVVEANGVSVIVNTQSFVGSMKTLQVFRVGPHRRELEDVITDLPIVDRVSPRHHET